MRIDPESTPTGRRMTHDAIAFEMTAHASVQVPLRLPGVLVRGPPTARQTRPTGWMHASALRRGPGHRKSRPRVTLLAEALLVVATRAARAVSARGRRMHRDPVIGMQLSWPAAPIVAVRALALRVARPAGGTVTGRRALVGRDEVRSVTRSVRRGRGDELSVRKSGSHPAVGQAQVARGAFTFCIASRRAIHVVALEAHAHARKLLARGECDVLDRVVALAAPDVTIRVRLVIEAQVRSWHDHWRHAIAVVGAVANMARRACSAARRRPLADHASVGVIGAVALIARGNLGDPCAAEDARVR